MKCAQCGHKLEFRDDAWPVELPPKGGDPREWVELWICPKCGYEEVL